MRYSEKVSTPNHSPMITGENLSFSQCGEDRIVRFIFDVLQMPQIRYLDIGAHSPTKLNNTYLFYTSGSTGVCIEPNPMLIDGLRRERERDVCLNIGLAPEENSSMPFYMMQADTLNTFCQEEAQRLQAEEGIPILGVNNIDVTTPNRIIKEFLGGQVNFISIDIEGNELSVIEAIDLAIYRPQVFCVETITYSSRGEGKKLTDVKDYLTSKGYVVYADTYINTIFVDQESMKRI